MISSLFYNIKQAFVQIFRNRGMSAASIFSILAMLLILGLVFIIVVNINLFTEIVKQDYDQVEVFIVDGTSEQQVQEVKAQIEAQPGVTSVEYRSQEDALKIMKERWGESGYLLDSLGDNPLPASLMISVESLDDAGSVASYAGKFDIIEDVQYYKDTVDKLTRNPLPSDSGNDHHGISGDRIRRRCIQHYQAHRYGQSGRDTYHEIRGCQ